MSRFLIGLVAAATACVGFAANLAFLRDAPITRLSQEELATFRAFVMKTLDEDPDGKTVEWKAPKTRFTSKITLDKSFTDSGRRCRSVRVNSKAHDVQMSGTYMLCKVSNGDWEFRRRGGQ